jgi:hypothetical protein
MGLSWDKPTNCYQPAGFRNHPQYRLKNMSWLGLTFEQNLGATRCPETTLAASELPNLSTMPLLKAVFPCRGFQGNSLF